MWAGSRTNLLFHLVHYHTKDTIVITKEGNRPHPRCPRCSVFVPWEALNGNHPTTDLCRRGVEQEFWLLAVDEAQAGAGSGVEM